MIFSYLKVALRSILRNRLTAFINIFGLALAMTCCLLIGFYIKDEISYDKYHTHADKIYRVTRNFLSPDGSVSLHLGHVAPPFGPLLKNDFPDMKEVARVIQNNMLLAVEGDGEIKFSANEPNIYVAEQSILDIFTISVLEGNQEKCLDKPFTIMLSDKMAEKYFNTSSGIVGKRLRADNQMDLEITGVFKSFPDQSHWHPDFLISFTTLNDDNIYGRTGLETNWGNNSFATYILAGDEFDPVKVESQFPDFLDKHMGQVAAQNNYPMPSTWTTLFLQPITAIHLYSHLDSEVEANGNINNVYMMGVIGLFIILIACFNFINLSTARASKRSKEVGLRKVVGAFKGQLISQYLGESILIALFSLVLALILSSLALPWMNSFTDKSLSFNILNNSFILLLICAFPVVIGILAGIYPAFVISSFKPALILKGQSNPHGKGNIRRILVVTQFSISIVLIIATAITIQQLDFMNNRELGYDKDQIVTINYYSDEMRAFEPFYNELVESSSIKNVGRSSIIPTGRLLDSQGSMVQQGDTLAPTEVVIKDVKVDHTFFETYGIPVVSGRNFSKAIQSDDSLAFVINEAAVRMIGWTNEEAIGKLFQNGSVKGQVVGVVKDFHFESLHESIIPVVFHLQPNYRRVSIGIAGTDMQAGLAHIEKVWKEFLPERPFEYQFLNERYHQLYESEQRQSRLFILFSGLAIFIAALGLLGLTTFNTLQRLKEISIRKVLGASVPSILRILSREIIILILVANVIAWPIAYYFMSQWLDGFAYRISMNLGPYIMATLTALLVAVLTVSIQTTKAAMTNPANTLRQE